MVTDTLQDYEALIESGFAEKQARALVRLVSPSRTDPEVLSRLDRIEQMLNTQSQTLGQHSQMFQVILPLVQRIPAMEQEIAETKHEVAEMKHEIAEMKEDIRDLRSSQHVIEERVKMEGRVSRMINATLIALGAIAASLVAAFAR